MSPYPAKFADWLAFETLGDPELEKLIQACWEWVQAFKSKASPRWLSLLGDSGVGKTHCSESLWRWSLNLGDFSESEFIPRKIVWPRFIQQLRSGNAFTFRDDLIRWPVLFLDDVGSERDTTGFATEELVSLLISRMGKWTLITSNKTPESLRLLDERIYSRLIRGKNICVAVNTKDYSTR